ncbi:MAG: 50S ribosomal protein L10 [Candidatus Nanohaloarchaea archaeon]|nr:50S ribosomal protein L10 [Candidatus Nanohaloarchaea archaeon]
MKLSREQKEKLVEDFKDRIDRSNVVGILDMHGLPAKQLQQIKKDIGDKADLVMSRKSLMWIALDKSDKENIGELKEAKAIQPAFIFSDDNPFTLYKLIQEKKSSAPASGGEIAPNDIVIEEGDTGIGPGPMIGKLQKLGAQTSVEGGSIEVTEPGTAVEEGEEITEEVADILNQLGMEPLEVGLDLKLVHEDGDILDKDVLEIDEDGFRSDFESAAAAAFNLAVNAGYLTRETAEPVLVEEIRKAKNLAVNASILEKEVVEDILSKAAGQARSVDSEIDLEDVEVEEDEEEEEAADESKEESGEEQEEDTTDEGEGQQEEDTGEVEGEETEEEKEGNEGSEEESEDSDEDKE